MSWEDLARDKLLMPLQCGVPFKVADLKARGGPNDTDIEMMREFSKDLASHGDVLMFGSGKNGQAASLMSGLIHAVAVLAFQPGGVRIFGGHFEV